MMDERDPSTLLDLAIQSLLSNEPVAIHSLGEIPKELFVPLFSAAFMGGYRKTLTEMVKVWPFACLHIGTLSVQEPQRELLKAMVESLQFLPVQNSAARSPKLRILDVRQGVDCRTTCPEFGIRSPTCFHGCTHSVRSILKLESQCSVVNSKPKSQSSRQSMEILVDLSLDGTLREREFFALLLNKVEQSSGSLHLCCRDLQIDKFSYARNTLKFLDLTCIHNLAVDQASLSEVTTILAHMIYLDSLSLSKITFRSLHGKVFQMFLNCLRQMNCLKEFNLSSVSLTDHLASLLRALPPDLDFLYLPFCEISYRDLKFLSQSSQATHLKLLNLSNNAMFWDDSGPFQILLQKLSDTLQHLAINHCHLTDATLSAILPALSKCSHLRVISFVSNPISMPMLMRILHYLTPLMELKYVIYPIPVHCYEQWRFHGSLDRQKLADVQAQLKAMLQAAKRSDMNWITYSQ
ncbi:melanoma antigen preferentially expressed in tumors-like [Peromyscus californicus insignis]|uniref:melanoma antigen preferentially expressed in tumors-like n=1 Tax=Peromyscus californicus insignis TaxID=564181 RepID=UPI0022A6B580|nr:melanoma antigen preferentially expressed in tumors-like [Peromyscus californicus insignis]